MSSLFEFMVPYLNRVYTQIIYFVSPVYFRIAYTQNQNIKIKQIEIFPNDHNKQNYIITQIFYKFMQHSYYKKYLEYLFELNVERPKGSDYIDWKITKWIVVTYSYKNNDYKMYIDRNIRESITNNKYKTKKPKNKPPNFLTIEFHTRNDQDNTNTIIDLSDHMYKFAGPEGDFYESWGYGRMLARFLREYVEFEHMIGSKYVIMDKMATVHTIDIKKDDCIVEILKSMFV